MKHSKNILHNHITITSNSKDFIFCTYLDKHQQQQQQQNRQQLFNRIEGKGKKYENMCIRANWRMPLEMWYGKFFHIHVECRIYLTLGTLVSCSIHSALLRVGLL